MSPELIGLVVGGAVGIAFLLLRLGARDGEPSVVGQRAVVTAPVSPASPGRIQLEDGEEWPARTMPPQRFEPGDEVVVAWVGQLGRNLYVGPADRALAMRPRFQARFILLGVIGAAAVVGVLFGAEHLGWSPGVALAAAAIAVTALVGVPTAVWGARRHRKLQQVVGRAAVVRGSAPRGGAHVEVEVDGEILPAVSSGPLPEAGEWVEVVDVAGWSGLVVEPTGR